MAPVGQFSAAEAGTVPGANTLSATGSEKVHRRHPPASFPSRAITA